MAANSISPPASTHPLRNPHFRLFWMGATISWTGDQFYLVALPWLVLQLTGSSIVLGTITMIAAFPRAGLMLLGGAVSDRFSPRRIMMTTATARTILVATVAALIWIHKLHLSQLYMLAFAFGVADAFAAPAAQTYLPSLVKSDQLPAANSVLQSTVQVTTLAAPAPAGVLIKAFGTAWAFLIDAVSFLFIIGALWRLPDPPSAAAAAPRRNVLRSILDGLRYVKNDVPLFSLIRLTAVLNFAITGPISVGLAFIAKQKFGTPSSFGLLMSAIGGGSLLGVFLAGLYKHRKRGRLLLITSTAIGLCLGTIGWLNQIAALATVLFLMGATVAFLNVQVIAWFQQRVDRAMMGRVMSVIMFSAVGLMPFSLAAAGFAIKWSLPGMFLVAAAMVLLVTLLAAANRPVREID